VAEGLKGLGSGGNRGLGVLGVELGRNTNEFASGWVIDVKGLAGAGLDPFAVDEAYSRLQQGRIIELEQRLLGREGENRDSKTKRNCKRRLTVQHTLGAMLDAFLERIVGNVDGWKQERRAGATNRDVCKVERRREDRRAAISFLLYLLLSLFFFGCYPPFLFGGRCRLYVSVEATKAPRSIPNRVPSWKGKPKAGVKMRGDARRAPKWRFQVKY
jgi:hypothetical protein